MRKRRRVRRKVRKDAKTYRPMRNEEDHLMKRKLYFPLMSCPFLYVQKITSLKKRASL
jgi:hypothetical protein